MVLKSYEKKFVIKLVFLLGTLILGLTVLYYSPYGNELSPKKLIHHAYQTPDNWWTFSFFLLLFVFGSWILLPLTLTSVLTIIVFPMWKATFCSILGVGLSATTTYLVGRYFFKLSKFSIFKKYMKSNYSSKESLSFWTIVALRLAPQPPFIATSLVAGSLKINYFVYLMASLLGLAPMVALGLLFGSRALKLVRDPSIITVTAMVAVIILIAVFIFVKKKYVKVRATR